MLTKLGDAQSQAECRACGATRTAKFLPAARHIEVPLFGGGRGGVPRPAARPGALACVMPPQHPAASHASHTLGPAAVGGVCTGIHEIAGGSVSAAVGGKRNSRGTPAAALTRSAPS